MIIWNRIIIYYLTYEINTQVYINNEHKMNEILTGEGKFNKIISTECINLKL